MYCIGEFSILCKVAIKNLRYYDEIDLLKPEYTDPVTNYRYYLTDQLIEIHTIQSYQQIGLSIKEIKLLLRGKEEIEILKKKKQELQQELEELQGQLKKIDFICSGEMDKQLINYKAVVKKVSGYIVYAKKMFLKSYEDYSKVILSLRQKVAELNPDLRCVQPEYNFIVYLEGGYQERDSYVEFCEAVDQFGVAPEGIEFKEIEPVTVVSVMHRGAYATLGLAYAFAATWVEKKGYMIAGNPRESFIHGIWNKENEEDWLTEIQIPIMISET